MHSPVASALSPDAKTIVHFKLLFHFFTLAFHTIALTSSCQSRPPAQRSPSSSVPERRSSKRKDSFALRLLMAPWHSLVTNDHRMAGNLLTYVACVACLSPLAVPASASLLSPALPSKRTSPRRSGVLLSSSGDTHFTKHMYAHDMN